ncbi:hypothetical protein CYANOKiyG1_54120 [Okeania sp. KiyG1]|nr:hypothetical protein CYANOKiyG1_54120 [Okeania sp. KiyG1]
MGDGEMGRWGDERIFLPAYAIGWRGITLAFSPILVPEFPQFMMTEDCKQKHIPVAKIPLRGSI